MSKRVALFLARQGGETVLTTRSIGKDLKAFMAWVCVRQPLGRSG